MLVLAMSKRLADREAIREVSDPGGKFVDVQHLEVNYTNPHERKALWRKAEQLDQPIPLNKASRKQITHALQLTVDRRGVRTQFRDWGNPR